MDMKNVYCLAFHPLVLVCLNDHDYFKILESWLNLILLLAYQMTYCSLILLILIFLVTKAPHPSHSIVYFVKKYIYGLGYRLGYSLGNRLGYRLGYGLGYKLGYGLGYG